MFLFVFVFVCAYAFVFVFVFIFVFVCAPSNDRRQFLQFRDRTKFGIGQKEKGPPDRRRMIGRRENDEKISCVTKNQISPVLAQY